MKEIFSVEDFKDYIEGSGLSVFNFSTRNQDIGPNLNKELTPINYYPLKLNLNFNTMIAVPHYNVIFLKNGRDNMQLERVKHITVESSDSMLGVIIKVICNKDSLKGIDTQYTFVAN